MPYCIGEVKQDPNLELPTDLAIVLQGSRVLIRLREDDKSRLT